MTNAYSFPSSPKTNILCRVNATCRTFVFAGRVVTSVKSSLTPSWISLILCQLKLAQTFANSSVELARGFARKGKSEDLIRASNLIGN